MSPGRRCWRFGGGELQVIANLGPDPVRLPAGAQLLLSSSPDVVD